MGPDVTAPENRTACPSCGGRLRPEATFCGQCYADFRPAPPPEPVQPLAPAAGAAYGTPASDPLTAPLLDVVLPAPAPVLPVGAVPAQAQGPGVVSKPSKPTGWPCTRCETVNDFTATVCAVCFAPFLAQLAEDSKVTVALPVVGDLSRYGRGQRAAIAVGAILLVLVPLALITLLLTKAPPDNGKPKTTSTTSSEVQPTPGTPSN